MRLYKTFYCRLSLLFLGVVALLGIGTYALVAPAFVSFLCETDQRVNFHVAEEMAADFEPLLEAGIDEGVLRERIAYLTGINPTIDIYLLSGDGSIRAYFSGEDRPLESTVIPMAPVHQLLNGGTLPIWGQDPFRPDQRRPFAAAPITIAGDPDNYIYVVLGGDRYYTVAEALRQSYIMQGSLRGVGYVLLLAVGIGLFMFFRVTRRLRAVNDAVAEFTSGNYQARLRDASDDEIGQLAQSFDQMAEAIAASVEDLERTDRLRRELIANVSHDLRSPLASIQGYLETIQIKEAQLTAEERRHHMEVVYRNTLRLGNLVSELFELSRLDAQQVTPQREVFSVAELVQDLVMQFLPQAEARGVELVAKLPDQVSLVRADIALVERALGNLIENALRHTLAGGRICVKPIAGDTSVRVEVCDTGEGIAEEALPHVFDRFYRASDPSRRDGGGLGLGLTIAQKIAELHGTTISVASELGRGTRFALSLPVAREAVA